MTTAIAGAARNAPVTEQRGAQGDPAEHHGRVDLQALADRDRCRTFPSTCWTTTMIASTISAGTTPFSTSGTPTATPSVAATAACDQDVVAQRGPHPARHLGDVSCGPDSHVGSDSRPVENCVARFLGPRRR